jgi:hypothetical protein
LGAIEGAITSQKTKDEEEKRLPCMGNRIWHH